MTDKAFKDLMPRLEKYYSGVTGKPVQIEQWALKQYYNACFCVFDDQTKEFYSELVGSFKFFPRVSEFREVAEKYRQGKESYSNAETCYCCMNTGVVVYVKKGLQPFPDYEYELMSRCYCDAGKNKSDWPMCTQLLQQGELEWLVAQNYQKYGDVKPDEGKRAKEYVQRFVKGFAS